MSRCYNIYHLNCLLPLILVCGLTIPCHGQDLNWQSFEDALTTADTTAKPILVDVWAPWCGWCHKMKKETYPRLTEVLNKNFVLTRLNRDDNQTKHQYGGQVHTSFELAQKMRVEQVPAIIFLTSDGEYLFHLSGYLNSKTLRPILKYISSRAYREQSYSQFQQQQ